MSHTYVPEEGDIIWIDFNPQSGHEQAGHRPALVLSPSSYNKATSLLICCPITRQTKWYPFEVNISGNPKNVALSEQVKSLDWVARSATKKGQANPAELEEVRAKIAALLRIST